MGTTSRNVRTRLRAVARRRLVFNGTPSAVRRVPSATVDMSGGPGAAQGVSKKRGRDARVRPVPLRLRYLASQVLNTSSSSARWSAHQT